jgi:molybdopterin/thiamine biosynthesis adenylyltransferase
MIVGLGSGGFPVMQHLAMSGWRKFTLIDPDELDSKNLVKHPGLRAEGGRKKVDIAAAWLVDRNPQCEVKRYSQPVEQIDKTLLSTLAKEATLVISATDSNSIRHFVNDLCIATNSPMSLGLVHRGGTGGTILLFRPGVSGCYACLEKVAEKLEGLPTDLDYPQTSLEEEMAYGRGVKGYAAAGLSADISLVSAMHAQASVAELLALEAPSLRALPSLSASWLAIQIRSTENWNWNVTAIDLPPIDDCVSCSSAISEGS